MSKILNPFVILSVHPGRAAARCTAHLVDHGAHLVRAHSHKEQPERHDPFARHALLVTRPEGRHDTERFFESLLAHVDLLVDRGEEDPHGALLERLCREHRVARLSLPEGAPGGRELPALALEARMGLCDAPLRNRPFAHELALLDTTLAAKASCAALAALLARAVQGRSAQLQIARAEVAYELLELNALFTLKAPRCWDALLWAATPWIAPWRCQDGEALYLHAGLSAHLDALLEALHELEPDLAEALQHALSASTRRDPTCVSSPLEHHRIVTLLEALFRRRTARAWERDLSSAGLCAVRVRSLKAWCAPGGHARAEGQLMSWRDEAGRERLTAAPVARFKNAPSRAPAPAVQVERLEQLFERLPPRRALPEAPLTQSAASSLSLLHGIKVLDLTQVIAGPVATRELALLGAEVLRVENSHFKAPWVEAFHVAYNAGKRASLTLDLRQPHGRETFDELIHTLCPDLLALNLRPGAGVSSGLDQETLQRRYPELIALRLSAYGEQGGDLAALPGWEQTAQAVTGVMLDWGRDEGVPDLFALPFHDLCTGLHGAQAALLALLAKQLARPENEPYPRVASSCLTHTSLLIQAERLHAQAFGPEGLALGKSSLGATALRRFYRASDRWGYLHLERPELLERVEGLERLRGVGPEALAQSLEAELITRPFEVWRERFAALGADAPITWVAARTQREVLNDPLAEREGLVRRVRSSELGVEVAQTGGALKIEGTRQHSSPAPKRQHLSAERAAAASGPLGALRWGARLGQGALTLALSKRRRAHNWRQE